MQPKSNLLFHYYLKESHTCTFVSYVPEAPREEEPIGSNIPATSNPIDPSEWPTILSDQVRLDLVQRGPLQTDKDFDYPKSPSNRSFSHFHTHRQLSNGEKIKRSWLVYSVKNDAVYCFSCKLFSRKSSRLIKDGQNDWVNIGKILKSHETSEDHIHNLMAWKELEIRIKTEKTIDKTEMELLQAEQNRWRQVLVRLVAIIQSLAERNLGFRGTVDKLNTPSNGNFLKEVELLARFDPVLQDHVRRITDGDNHTTYLGKNIQNQLIDVISQKICSAIVSEIRESKYFSIILDCTPDVSHQEQMSVIVRIVSLKSHPEIKEHFLGFLPVLDTTGLGLSNVILERLKELNINFDDCRSQSYDNGSNMKGKNKGVQARLLQKNPRALYVPLEAISFFGMVQKLYNLFSSATQRWSILKEHANITLKSWSETRWESRLTSIEPLYQHPEKLRQALIDVREKTNDATTRVEAQYLADELGSYRFQICTVVWYMVLSNINKTSKLLQSPTMQIDVAVSLIEKTKTMLLEYRKTGFAEAQLMAKERCGKMNVEAVLKEKHLRNTKRQFNYEAPDECITNALNRLEVSFFNIVVDTAIQSVQDRFDTITNVRDKFSVLYKFPTMDEKTLTKNCEVLGDALTDGNLSDLDWRELINEIRNLPNLPDGMTTFEHLCYLQEKQLTDLYPNFWVGLRIASTIPVTVASAERSFSKLKLIKTYLRSTMGQERLSGLAMISINHQLGKELDYADIINDFAAAKARRMKI
uniref:TTF-type domain-containing protein n=1 Tax=Oryzias sinensis TaxID=183150 RepID=A0A8C8A234_9TELE